MGRKMSARGLKTRQNRKSLTPPIFSLQLTYQSQLGYLLIDRVKELERIVRESLNSAWCHRKTVGFEAW